MSYRKNDANGLRSDEEHKVNVAVHTDFESRMAPAVRQTLKDLWGDVDLVDHGIDNTGAHIPDDEEFIARNGGAFDWAIHYKGREQIADAQVHTAYCTCLTLKHKKLEKAAREKYAVFIVEEEGFVWLSPQACKHIMDAEVCEMQESIGDKLGYRFNTGRINFAIRVGWASYFPYSEAALKLVDLGCFPKHYCELPRVYAANR